ncbi:MAG: DNA-deoxyinosine glycosylase [Kiritimatiellales bacterium]|nr:DNA-deoxyinosine glycosylase [Kiritimatiellales bacterium]
MTGKIQSFPFSADKYSRVLILGSMPGEESLKQNQYYAHPRNLFWDFMGGLFEARRELPYEKRLDVLRKNGVALWDVAHTCRRKGSLDSNMTDVVANDFEALFAEASQIHTVFFNGQKTAALFRKLVLPDLQHKLNLITLPSTSPANASVSIAKKKAAWKHVRAALHH